MVPSRTIIPVEIVRTRLAAKALNMTDRGTLEDGKKADFVVFETDNFQNILYRQGTLSAHSVYINGEKIK